MRTTVDIPDALLERAKARARRDGTTLRSLLNDGLRAVLDEEAHRRSGPFELPTYGTGGLAPGISERDLFDRDERDLGPRL